MTARTVMKGKTSMERKILSISSKRQITIPQKFFNLIGFGDEAECILRGNELILRPARNPSGGEFAEQILAELIDDGLSGKELLAEFKKRQEKIRPAVELMIAESENVASGNGEFMTYDDVFGAEEDE